MRSIISRVVLLCVLLQCWMQAGFSVPVSNQTGIAASNQTIPVTKIGFLASNQTIPVTKNGFLASNQTISVKKEGFLASNQTIPVKKNGFLASNQTISVKKNGFLASNQTVPDKKNRSLAPNQAPTTTARVTTVPTKPTCQSVLRNLELHPPPNIKVKVREPVRNYLQAKYRCVKGTYMKNGKTQAMRRCKNGKMIGRSVTCQPIVCGKPNPVPHATFTGTLFTYKSKINYTCDMGYKMKGTKTWRTCKRNGKWTKKPSCIVSKCRISKGLRIRHGTINTTDPEYKDGTTLTFTCDHGYELTGDSTAIECVKGKWSSYRLPICKAIACPDPTKYFSNGRFNGRNFRVNKTVEFICNAGMKLIGSKKRTCQPNKLWSGSLAVCDDGNSYCPNPGVPISGRKIGHRYNLGSIVRFKCDYGYVLVGSAVRQCMQDGKWNGTETVCMAEFQYMVRNSKSNAFMLKKNIDRMLEYTCSGINTTCNMTAIDMRARAINPKHAGGLDIVFVFDASSSIRKKDFNLSKRFAQELVTVLGASWKPGGTHVAAVTYGTNPHLVFNLGDASALSVENVVKKLGEIRRSGGGTATRAALNMVIKTVVPNTRQQSQKTLFFITDGRSNIGGRPQKAAEHLRDKNNFEIYAVGVGKKVDVMELRSIASEPENDHVLVVENYKQLVENIKKAVYIKIDYSPCGVSPTSFRARMVGGNKAGRGTWPWQVGLYKSGADGNWDITCGGALIDRQWVLTAAHCFYHYDVFTNTRELQIIPASQYIVKAGDDYLRIKEPAQQDIEASGIYIHNNYRDSPIFENDIALLKLSKKVKLGPFVRTVCLPRKDEDLVVASKHGYVAGWGVTQVLKLDQNPLKKHKNSKTLQHSAFTIQNSATCANTTFFFNPNVTFCAGSGLGGNDTCHGDSGGSFVRQASRGVNEHRWVSVGLVSWGEGCGLRGKYGYYTRVEPYIDWIKKTIQDNNTD